MSRKHRRDKHNQKANRQSQTERSKNVPKGELDLKGRIGFLEHLSLTLADVVMFGFVVVLAVLLTKYIGEDRMLTIHLFVALVLAVVLFVTLRVNAWLSRTANLSSSRVRPKTVWSCFTLLSIAGVVVDDYLVSGLRRKEPHLEEPAFEETVTQAEFSIGGGGMHFLYPLAALEGAGWPPIMMGSDVPFRVYVEKGRLFVDATVTGIDGQSLVEIHRNRFTVGVSAWDHNSSKQALEVVDSNRNPVFQLIYRSPTQIEVDGIFPTAGGLIWATPITTVINPTKPLPPLKPIFKYPSWRYPGVFAEP